jgi:hypothetical protein
MLRPSRIFSILRESCGRGERDEVDLGLSVAAAKPPLESAPVVGQQGQRGRLVAPKVVNAVGGDMDDEDVGDQPEVSVRYGWELIVRCES